MRLLIYIILMLSLFSIYGCGIWAIVEFILYLAKDMPFNWWSLYSCIISLITAVIFWILSMVFD